MILIQIRFLFVMTLVFSLALSPSALAADAWAPVSPVMSLGSPSDDPESEIAAKEDLDDLILALAEPEEPEAIVIQVGRRITEYDEQGRRIKLTVLNSKYKVANVTYFDAPTGKKIAYDLYHADGLTIKTHDTFNLAGGRVSKTTYSAAGLTLLHYEYHPTTHRAVLYIAYHPDGITEKDRRVYRSNGTLQDRWLVDTAGRLTQRLFYNTAGTKTSSILYTYRSSGTLLSIAFRNASNRTLKRETFRENGTLERREEFDTAARRTFTTEFFSDGSTPRLKTTYFTNGRVRFLEEYRPAGTLKRKDEYKSTGALLKTTFYDLNGFLVDGPAVTESTVTLISGIWRERTTVDYAQGTKVTEHFGFDGKRYETQTFDVESGLALSRRWYDAAGNVTREIVYASGSPSLYREYSAGVLTRELPASASVDNGASVLSWMESGQKPSGLIPSHPEDPAAIFPDGNRVDLKTQAYSYDQALAGIAFLDAGRDAAAQAILEFYYSELTNTASHTRQGLGFDGFYTVYNVNDDEGNWWRKYEWSKRTGDNSWVAIFALRYHAETGDARALEIAEAIADWIRTRVPHKNGGVAMGEYEGSGPNYGTLYSVENVLDYHAVLAVLSQKASTSQSRANFAAEQAAVAGWLKNEAYDAGVGLFRRGGSFDPATGATLIAWDGVQALDVNTWAVTSIGVEGLAAMGIDAERVIASAQAAFAVQKDGSFGGSLFQAKGFDYSNAANASSLHRTGLKWVEGTQQMVSAYNELAATVGLTNSTKGVYYTSLAQLFQTRNPENLSPAGSYVASDMPGQPVFVGNDQWRTSEGASLASTAWAYFSLRSLNPFKVS